MSWAGVINVKQNREVEKWFNLPRLEMRLYMIFYDFLTGLLQPYVHTYKNIKDLVDIFSSDLDAVYLQYFVALR